MQTRALAFSLTLLAASLAAADVVANPSFEGTPGLSGWATSGEVRVTTGAPAAPTEGEQGALLTSRPTLAAPLAAFLGCTTAQLKAAAETTTEVRNGSAISQTFTVHEGDTLMFDFMFNNGEETNNLEWPDTAFVVINGEPFMLASSASTEQGWGGVQRFSKGQLSEGEVTVAFAVCNFADFAMDSQLMIDNVTVMTGVVLLTCGPADLGSDGGQPGFDGRLDNNDFIAFINYFFAGDGMADHGSQGGVAAQDGIFDNNDFVVFINEFFEGSGRDGCNS